MLMEPASKVSVPLAVVMRTLSRTLDTVLLPAIVIPVFAAFSLLIAPNAVQVFEDKFENITRPCQFTAADANAPGISTIPLDAFAAVYAVLDCIAIAVQTYPVFSTPPEEPS